MRTALNAIGIDEADFIRECNASMKQGTWFKDWVDTNDQPYYHPFSMPEALKSKSREHWLSGEAGDLPFAEAVTRNTSYVSSRSPQATGCPQLRLYRQLRLPFRRREIRRSFDTTCG